MKKELEQTYKNIGELYKNIREREEEYIIATTTNKNIVTVMPMDRNGIIELTNVIVFEILENNSLKQIDMEGQRKRVIEKIAKYIEPEKLLMEVLKGYEPEQMMELHERVIEKKAKVTSGKGCYSLKIGGKRGTPFELYLGGV